jgi:hypothetical protein
MNRPTEVHPTILLVLLVATFLASLAAKAEASWQTTTIDSLAADSRNPGIAIDSSGTVHLAYYADLGESVAIKYAKQMGSNWQIQTVAVENTFASGDRVRIEIDSQNRPHIAYHTFSSFGGDVGTKYATLAGGSWTSTLVHPPSIRGRVPDIAVDSFDNPHVVLHDNGGLGYGSYHSYFNGSSWQTEPITSIPNQANGGILLSTVGVDSLDQLHVAGFVGGSLYYANNKTGAWINETTSPNPVDSASLVIDSLGQPVVGYHNLDNNTVGISVLAASGWQHDVLTPSIWRMPVSLALGPNDERFLTFYDDDGVRRQLQFARYRNGWQFDTIATFAGTSTTPIGASLAIHPNGTPYVVYGDESRGLRLAIWVPEPMPGTLILMAIGLLALRRERF